MPHEVQDPVQTSPMWKKPDEVMQLHRMKRKKKALQERMRQPSAVSSGLPQTLNTAAALNFSRILNGEKRKNPFCKNKEEEPKRHCESAPFSSSPVEESSDSTLFQLLAMSNNSSSVAGQEEKEEAGNKLATFTSLLNHYSKEQQSESKDTEVDSGKKYIPVDWSLKTKLRLMSPSPFPWNQTLKASEEASGITGFVRCLDTSKSSTLDTSHHARFHQTCLYWQHPSLPWVSLFPRSGGRVSHKSTVGSNEEIKSALLKEWTDSFRSLFQLIRARQCPYFYVCSNTFTCLFRAAGIGGISETCAFLSPTTRGLRQTLKQEEIEFTMPLKKSSSKRKSDENDSKSLNTSDEKRLSDGQKNSTDSCYDTMDSTSVSQTHTQVGTLTRDPHEEHANDSADDDDELESEEWLQSLGVAADEIKKINYSQLRITQAAESEIDRGEESLVCVQGVDAQALFNFLLNCKSCVSGTGALAGVPPTLLAPVAFQGGTLKPLKVRESVVHSEGGQYYSVELRGPLLPTAVHSLTTLLGRGHHNYSITLAALSHTQPFSRVAQLLANDEKSKENSSKVPSVFGRENLSDCGLSPSLLQTFCSSDPQLTQTISSLAYLTENNSYTWA